MAKKGDLATSTKKRMTSKEREELLIENFVGLQKAMTHLSIKFENLSNQISELLKIFEISAKNIVEGGSDKELINKLNSLLEQNKTIAHGLVLIEEKLRTPAPSPPIQPQGLQGFQRPKQLPRI